ncbi:YnfA family protein [Veillonella agrestimuris]|uniref:YnfA family protein n=1 Tax=Veillonella agrestimuris TaxID=2941340 RepID=UPI0020400536|nr:YnfA family protein [Veillonella agrestimuris]
MLLSILYFLLAGLAEIGGGYLIWLYMKADKGPLYFLVGGIILILYGIIPTLQPVTSFGKVYAAYGGVFIILSVLWGWLVDGIRPDTYDVIGSLICLIGVYIIMYAPR